MDNLIDELKKEIFKQTEYLKEANSIIKEQDKEISELRLLVDKNTNIVKYLNNSLCRFKKIKT